MQVKTMRVKTLLTALLIGSASLLVACGDSSEPSSSSSSGMDTREVTKQPETRAPSLDQRVESGQIPQNNTKTLDVQETTSEPIMEAIAKEVEAETVVSVVSGQSLYASCMGCHGATGAGGVGPQLSAKTKDFLVQRMVAYRAGEHVGPMTAMMAPMVSAMTDDEIDRVVDYILTF